MMLCHRLILHSNAQHTGSVQSPVQVNFGSLQVTVVILAMVTKCRAQAAKVPPRQLVL